MRGRFIALGCVAAAALGAQAQAGPRVDVRARTVVQLQPIERTQTGIIISGQVTDRASPEPVPYAQVIITVDDRQFDQVADDDGRFRLAIDAEEGTHDIVVSFPGDSFRDSSGEKLTRFNVENEPLELSVTATALENDSWEVAVRAQSGGRPAQVPVNLWGGDIRAPQLARLSSLTTDGRGRAEVSFTRAQLGGFGDKRMEARFGGNDTYDPATGSTVFSIAAKTSITLTIEEGDLAFEDTLRGRGVARDEDGTPLADQRVVLLAGVRELDETTTNDEGAFKLSVEASEIGQGKTAVQAALFPQASYLAVSRSPPLSVSVDEKKPVPIAATLAAFGATCAALLAFVGLRTRPWEAWLARLSRQEPEKQSASEKAVGRRPPGLAPARPSLVSTLRRPSDFGFTGGVFDVLSNRPIADAIVSVKLDTDAARGTKTTDAGSFILENLPAGAFSATVTATGYVSESFQIVVPHRGELRNARVDLLAVREHIFDLYGDLARPLLPDEDRWGVWSPRQIFEHVRSSRRAPSLRELTDYVEEIYFSQRAPVIAAIADAEERIARTRLELLGPLAVASLDGGRAQPAP